MKGDSQYRYRKQFLSKSHSDGPSQLDIDTYLSKYEYAGLDQSKNTNEISEKTEEENIIFAKPYSQSINYQEE